MRTPIGRIKCRQSILEQLEFGNCSAWDLNVPASLVAMLAAGTFRHLGPLPALAARVALAEEAADEDRQLAVFALEHSAEAHLEPRLWAAAQWIRWAVEQGVRIPRDADTETAMEILQDNGISIVGVTRRLEIDEDPVPGQRLPHEARGILLSALTVLPVEVEWLLAARLGRIEFGPINVPFHLIWDADGGNRVDIVVDPQMWLDMEIWEVEGLTIGEAQAFLIICELCRLMRQPTRYPTPSDEVACRIADYVWAQRQAGIALPILPGEEVFPISSSSILELAARIRQRLP